MTPIRKELGEGHENVLEFATRAKPFLVTRLGIVEKLQ